MVGMWWEPGPFHPLFMVSRERLFLSKSHFGAFRAVCKVFRCCVCLVNTGVWGKMTFILGPFEQVACVGTRDVLDVWFFEAHQRLTLVLNQALCLGRAHW